MIKYFLFFLLIFTPSVFPQCLFKEQPLLRIRIIHTLNKLQIQFNNDWSVSGNSINNSYTKDDGEIVFRAENNKIKILKKDGSLVEEKDSCVLKSNLEKGTLKIKNVPFGVGWWWESKEDRIYEGEVHIYVTKQNKFEVVIHLPIEEYIKGVVPYEIGNNSPLEATKAQAVAARSEAVKALESKMFSGEHHDLTSDVECQVFSGNIKRTATTDRAVDESTSIILEENGKPINAYYSSNCGGHSELIKNVWGGRHKADSYNVANFDAEEEDDFDLSSEKDLRKWLFSNPKSYCNPNTNSDLPVWSKNNFRWKFEFTVDELTKSASKGKDYGKLVDIKTISRGESGRAVITKFIFEKESVDVKSELKIRQMFSPPLRSASFVVDKADSGFVVYGAGWGHGVGMCQSGAITMAKNGKTFEEILKHYYRKADLIKIY